MRAPRPVKIKSTPVKASTPHSPKAAKTSRVYSKQTARKDPSEFFKFGFGDTALGTRKP
jgi:hypothetical protein